MSTRRGDNTVIRSHTRLEVAEGYFVDVVNSYDQLTLSRERLLDNTGGPPPIT